MVRLPIYLDNHATTRTDPRVLDAMLPFFTEHYGNAASRTHAFGWKAEEAVDTARGQVAALIGADAKEIVFTSGATESNNLAIKGVAGMHRREGNHIVTVQTEHRAVLDPCRRLQGEGFDVTFLPVDRFGRVSPEQVADAITPRTILISVMLANNEVGTLQPVASIGKLCKQRGVLLHTDATQAVGRVPVDVETLQADLLSLSAHKLYGPRASAPFMFVAATPTCGWRRFSTAAAMNAACAAARCRSRMSSVSARLAAWRLPRWLQSPHRFERCVIACMKVWPRTSWNSRSTAIPMNVCRTIST